MSLFGGFKNIFGFGNNSHADLAQQSPILNPATGLEMVPGTLHDVGGNNIGTSPASDFNDPFGSGCSFSSFDTSFGYSSFDDF